MDWTSRIEAKPDVCHGRACVRGTRIMVSVLLDNLAAGRTPAQIVADYPPLTPDDLQASLAYAAELARERLIPMVQPT